MVEALKMVRAIVWKRQRRTDKAELGRALFLCDSPFLDPESTFVSIMSKGDQNHFSTSSKRCSV
jgi:hypothetical protein